MSTSLYIRKSQMKQGSAPLQFAMPFLKHLWLWIALSVSATSFAQTTRDTLNTSFKFSGTISVTTNGISPIPAFSLDKPAIAGFLSLRKNRFSYDPEIAFSTQGVPWFLNNCFRYRLIETPKFGLRTGVIWGLGYSYPTITENGVTNTVAKAERFAWLDLLPAYQLSKKLSLSSRTLIGYNFEPGSVKRIHYFSLSANLTQIHLARTIDCEFYPQLFYLNLDGNRDGFFVSGVAGVRYAKLPLFLSTQMNSTLTTSISPDPGFKWNISLTYSF